MAPLSVHAKHLGKTYSLHLETDEPPKAFKHSIYAVTGVPVDRMKVLFKGGVLKDDNSWAHISLKDGQTFTVIGAAGELPKPPSSPIVFLEDMDDSELAEALAKPVGLRNLGNTCYMNASVQALRAIPELQVALSAPSLQSSTPLPSALHHLYQNMSRTTDSITPLGFLQVLRQVNPQFAELAPSGKTHDNILAGYAQQDAEECYGTIINTLRNVPGLAADGTLASGSEAQAAIGVKKFIEQYMMGEMQRELRCDEAQEEAPTVSIEQVLKLECNISITTNFMLSGILDSLNQKVEKTSPSLGRQAIYTQKSRLSRLPSYLTVHMVRFAWRADVSKKAKIMRKVRFPLEFDTIELVTDELKGQLLPVSRRLLEIEKERGERRKVRRRTRVNASAPTTDGDVQMVEGTSSDGAGPVSAEPTPAAGVLQEERVYREREDSELAALVSPELKDDIGCSKTGLYDLIAIVTHKGAAADAGHYMGYVKKSVFNAAHSPNSPTAAHGKDIEDDDDDDDWYKFDDDKVSIFPREKLGTLDGGGEDSSAYVLLYRSKAL